jgi:outer membrane lipoprotein carrier protein
MKSFPVRIEARFRANARATSPGFAVATTMAIAMAMATAAIATAADSPAATLQEYLDGLSSFEAQFRQQVVDSRGRTAEESSGRLYLQKPDRFRWDYANPGAQQIVSDGRNLWHYDADLEQVMVKSLDESLSTTPALLLAGKQDVTEGYEVTDQGTRDGLEWIGLTPRRDDTDFRSLALGFAQGTLRAMELQDKLGQRTRIDFGSIRRNPPLDRSLFVFTPPPGVDVIGTAR